MFGADRGLLTSSIEGLWEQGRSALIFSTEYKRQFPPLALVFIGDASVWASTLVLDSVFRRLVSYWPHCIKGSRSNLTSSRGHVEG